MVTGLMCTTKRPVDKDTNANSVLDEDVTILALCVVYLLHRAKTTMLETCLLLLLAMEQENEEK